MLKQSAIWRRMVSQSKIKCEMLIRWSEEDNCYFVGFPDFPGQQWRTHGDTYELTVANGVEALESLVMAYTANGESLPEHNFVYVNL
jgi:antitoxin HicB